MSASQEESGRQRTSRASTALIGQESSVTANKQQVESSEGEPDTLGTSAISEQRVNTWLHKAKLQLHPWAAQIPRMSVEQFVAFKADVEKLGRIRDPIWLKDKQLVDGLHRLGACIELEIEPRFEEYPDDDLIEFINSKNLHRRHLKPEQWRDLHKKLVPEVEKQLKEEAEKNGDAIAVSNETPIRKRGGVSGQPGYKNKAVAKVAKMTGKSPATVHRNIRTTPEQPPESKARKRSDTPTEHSRDEIYVWFGERTKKFFNVLSTRDLVLAKVKVIKALFDDEEEGGEPMLQYPSGKQRTFLEQIEGDKKGGADHASS
jgi:hypothetical protein